MKINKKIQRFLPVMLAVALLGAIMFICVLTANAKQTDFAGGSGTEADPYLISTKEHLNNVRNDLDAHYKMIADITFADADFAQGGDFYNDGTGWIPIGVSVDNAFNGTFDGNGCSIENLFININSSASISVGLFGVIKGTVKNLEMCNTSIFVNSTSCYVGGIVGYSYSSGYIEKCSNTGSINATSTAGSTRIGGIVGYSSGDIKNCYNTGSVSASSTSETSDVYTYAGGVVGLLSSKTVSNCYNLGNISSVAVSNDTSLNTYDAYNYTGGIAGRGGSVKSCYNAGTVNAISDSTITSIAIRTYCYAGGMVGNIWESSSTVKSCYNVGVVKGKASYICYVGGIVGDLFDSTTVDSCYYLESISDGTGFGRDTCIKCTSEEMTQMETFVGFDFENIWEIKKANQYPFPTLRLINHTSPESGNTVEFSGGTGTIWNPYLIETKEHLDNVRNYPDAYYKMVTDITFTDSDFAKGGAFYNDGKGWIPIGNKENKFTGTFNGQGNTISGLRINEKIEETVYVGLFGCSTGLIKNLNIENSVVRVVGDSTKQSTDVLYAYIGSVVGYGKVDNCNNHGEIKVSYSSATIASCIYVGGIAGYATSNVNSCNYGPISLKIASCSGNQISARIGGVVGYAKDLESCQNKGNITATSYCDDSYLYIGGVVGHAITVTGCSNIAKIKASETGWYGKCYIGGISGYANRLEQCYNSGYIYGDINRAKAGGIVGYTDGCVVENSYNSGFIKGSVCGGIVGDVFGAATIKYCYNTGFIEEGYHKYAILGDSASTSVIENCYSLEGMAKSCSLTNVRTAEEMFLQNTYIGFDFDAIWRIGNSSNCPWPELSMNPMDPQVKDITNCKISLDKSQVQYMMPQPKVTVTYNGEVLQIGEDYILQFAVGDESWLTDSEVCRNMASVGLAKILVIGIDSFINREIIDFDVAKFDLANAELYSPWTSNGEGQSSGRFMMENFIYDGTEKKQIGFRVGYDFDTITSENYEISYRNNVNPGTATLVITGKGDLYTGKLEKNFTIYPRLTVGIVVTTKPNKLSYMEGESFDTTGMVVTAHYNNNTSSVITDYTVSGYSPTIGTKTITISYAGLSATFTITVNRRVPSAITSNKHTVSGGKISKISVGIPVSTLLASLNEGVFCKIYSGNTVVSGEKLVGTGMLIKIMDGNTVKASYTAVVTGDTNGDGGISVTDMITVKAHLLKKSTLSGVYATAADTNGDGSISITDFIQIKAQILKKGDIIAR